MGNFFKEAAKCRVEIESWVEIGEIGKAETELSRLRYIREERASKK